MPFGNQSHWWLESHFPPFAPAWPEQPCPFFFPPWIDYVVYLGFLSSLLGNLWTPWTPSSSFTFRLKCFRSNVSAQMFPLMLCLNVILLYVLLHSRPACMSHTYNHGLTLWLQNEAFLSSENIVLAQRHERRYLVLKHGGFSLWMKAEAWAANQSRVWWAFPCRDGPRTCKMSSH